jgi:hypothetical protein
MMGFCGIGSEELFAWNWLWSSWSLPPDSYDYSLSHRHPASIEVLKINYTWTEDVTQGVECLPNRHKALSSNPNTLPKKLIRFYHKPYHDPL